jgi:hypothetical protein
MVKQPGELLPEVIETRNTQHHIERLVGGAIKPIAFNHPIYGVVQLGGPAGSAYTTVFVHHDQGYWSGLSIEEQKRISKWFLATTDKDEGRGYSNER